MTQDIYSPPVADPSPADPMDRKRGRKVAVWGLVLLSTPIVGLVITVVAIPVGTLVGIVLIIGFIVRWGEFRGGKEVAHG